MRVACVQVGVVSTLYSGALDLGWPIDSMLLFMLLLLLLPLLLLLLGHAAAAIAKCHNEVSAQCLARKFRIVVVI